MYHEHAMTEGCASPPPPNAQHSRASPYYNIVSPYKNPTLLTFSPNNASLQQSTTKSQRGRRRKTDPDTDESESDPDQLTSSRTESSNQLDVKLKHSKLNLSSFVVFKHKFRLNYYRFSEVSCLSSFGFRFHLPWCTI